MNEPVNIKPSPPHSTPKVDGAVNDEIKEYNKATRLAKLLSILLEKIDFKSSPDALRGKDSELARELNVKTEILHYDPAAGDCIAAITWTIKMKYKRKNVAKCSANYIVVYKEMKDCSIDTVKMFIDNVGKTATYAYFRALYAHLDWSANLGSPPLPVLHFSTSIGKIRRKLRERQAQSS